MPQSKQYIKRSRRSLGSRRNMQNHNCVGTFMKDVKKGRSWDRRYSSVGKRGMSC